LRRLLIVLASGLLAGLGGTLFLVVALLVDGTMLRAGTSVAIVGVSSLLAAELQGMGAGHLVGLVVTLVWAVVVAVCFAPVFVAAALGEAARVRSFVWYGGAAGALAAAVPTLARAFGALPVRETASGAAVEGRATLVFFLTGVVAGSVYWLLAGRSQEDRAP
jgi:hypothetical protein